MPKALLNRLTAKLAIATLGVDLSGASEAPTDFRIIPAGAFRAIDGRPTECESYVCLEEDGRRIAAELSARVSKRVVDYEHATLHAKKTGKKAPAAGWFKNAEWRADGVWLLGVEWTAQAAKDIVDKVYRYVSPVFSYDPVTGRVQTLYHAALTNDPGLDGLTDLAALAAEMFLTPINPQENSMNETLKALLAALGLAETATQAEALSALAAIKTNVATLSAQIASPDPSKFVPIATLTALQGENADLKTKYTALQAEVDGGKLEKVIADGKAAGKITPALEPWARDHGKNDLASLSAWIGAAPVIVTPGGMQTDGKQQQNGAVALSAEQKSVCALLNVSEEDFQKTLTASA